MEPADRLAVTMRGFPTTDPLRLGVRFLVLSGLVLAAAVALPVNPAAAPDRVLVGTLLVIVPGMLGGFGHGLLLRGIGAPQMSLPWAGAAAFWIVVAAVGIAAAGVASHDASLLRFASLAAAGAAVLLAVNHVATIAVMPEHLGVLRLAPFFVWGVLASSIAVLLFVPLLAGAITVLGMDTVLSDAALSPTMPIMLPPLAIIAVAPAVGMLADVALPGAADPWWIRARYGLLAVALVSVVVWARQCLAWHDVEWFAAAGAALLIAGLLPMLGGREKLDAAGLWVQGAVFVFLTAVAAEFVLLAKNVPGSFGHFQAALSLGCVFAGFAGFYRSCERLCGRSIREGWGRAHFATAFVGVNLTLLPAHLVTVAPGLARPLVAASLRLLQTFGTGFIAVSLIVFAAGLGEALLASSAIPDRGSRQRIV